MLHMKSCIAQSLQKFEFSLTQTLLENSRDITFLSKGSRREDFFIKGRSNPPGNYGKRLSENPFQDLGRSLLALLFLVFFSVSYDKTFYILTPAIKT